MRSTQRPSQDDLSTRARIRDAAVRLFGSHGFAKTTIRAVAAEAGVSPGLVIHHFGSKDGLRARCDEFILGHSSERARETTDAQRWGTKMGEYLANMADYMPEVAYIRQSMVDESDAGAAFFDALVDQTEDALLAGMANGSVRELEDPRGTAVVMAGYSIGMLTVGKHVARSFGADDFNQDIVRRIGVPATELYTVPLYTDSSMLDAAREALRASVQLEDPQQAQQQDPHMERQGKGTP